MLNVDENDDHHQHETLIVCKIKRIKIGFHSISSAASPERCVEFWPTVHKWGHRVDTHGQALHDEPWPGGDVGRVLVVDRHGLVVEWWLFTDRNDKAYLSEWVCRVLLPQPRVHPTCLTLCPPYLSLSPSLSISVKNFHGGILIFQQFWGNRKPPWCPWYVLLGPTTPSSLSFETRNRPKFQSIDISQFNSQCEDRSST